MSSYGIKIHNRYVTDTPAGSPRQDSFALFEGANRPRIGRLFSLWLRSDAAGALLNPSIEPRTIATIAILGLIAWRLYSRVRRSVGRQLLSRRWAWVRGVLLPALLGLLLLTGQPRTVDLLATVAGVGIGIALGVAALRLTRFEASGEAVYYTPNPYIALTLMSLLVFRLGYRFMKGGFPLPPPGTDAPPPALTPLTLLIFGALVGYSTTYAVGLIRKSKLVAVVARDSDGTRNRS